MKNYRDILNKVSTEFNYPDFNSAIKSAHVDVRMQIMVEAKSLYVNQFAVSYPREPYESSHQYFMRVLRKLEPQHTKVKNFTPENWPADAPPYHSADGWEYEKRMKFLRLRVQVNIIWLEKVGSPRHLLIAKRLQEILDKDTPKEGNPPFSNYEAGIKEGDPPFTGRIFGAENDFPFGRENHFLCDWARITKASHSGFYFNPLAHD